MLGAPLNSCKLHKNSDVAEETVSPISNLNSEATGSYMLLSNCYATNGRWDESAKVRLSARTRGLNKIAGDQGEVKKKLRSGRSHLGKLSTTLRWRNFILRLKL
uniref:Uncharacterized protein n=1 Tax=Utricularia reniformis TaxID=192314 RepID=A0A1Y0AYX7_9LAMI|nr:hypothetical protein AEK19_MT1243 [Utricularia reniformis]ART30360.1 hypothetical protein AEK19_MT1243 [Utricularia reniformis]